MVASAHFRSMEKHAIMVSGTGTLTYRHINKQWTPAETGHMLKVVIVYT